MLDDKTFLTELDLNESFKNVLNIDKIFNFMQKLLKNEKS
jgi:hypothetical protein